MGLGSRALTYLKATGKELLSRELLSYLRLLTLLGGPWVDTSRVISRVTLLITHIKGLRTPLITTHEPPSTLGEPKPQTLKPEGNEALPAPPP